MFVDIYSLMNALQFLNTLLKFVVVCKLTKQKNLKNFLMARW